MLCTHEAAAAAAIEESVANALVQVIAADENVCAIGYAMDALHRLGLHVPMARLALRCAMSETTLFPSDALSRPLGVSADPSFL
jgi:hypothetical protein